MVKSILEAVHMSKIMPPGREKHDTKNEDFHRFLRIWSLLLKKSFMKKFFVLWKIPRDPTIILIFT